MDKSYSITELAEILNISDHTIRKYEKDFQLKIPRTSKNHRYYTGKELELFKRIIQWKKSGLNKDTINKMLHKSVEAIKQEEQVLDLVEVNKLTGEELKTLITKQLEDVILEREEKLHEHYTKKIESLESQIKNHIDNSNNDIVDKLDSHLETVTEENRKLQEYIKKAREEENNKGFMDKFKGLFKK